MENIEAALTNVSISYSRVSKYCVASIKIRTKLSNKMLFHDIVPILISTTLQFVFIVFIWAAELNTTNR